MAFLCKEFAGKLAGHVPASRLPAAAEGPFTPLSRTMRMLAANWPSVRNFSPYHLMSESDSFLAHAAGGR